MTAASLCAMGAFMRISVLHAATILSPSARVVISPLVTASLRARTAIFGLIRELLIEKSMRARKGILCKSIVGNSNFCASTRATKMLSCCRRSSKTLCASLLTISIVSIFLIPLSVAENFECLSVSLSLKKMSSAAMISPSGIDNPPQIHDALISSLTFSCNTKGRRT